MLDVKSLYRTHIVKSVRDDGSAELWCGRIGTTDADEAPRGGAVCDSCQAALRFTLDADHN